MDTSQRNSNWENARAKYNIGHSIKNQSQIDEIIAFFRARKGKAYGFRFKDWSDYKAEGEFIANGNGVKTEFQLIKSYISGSDYIIREIKKPVDNSEKIYINSILQIRDTDYMIDIKTGIISFISAPADTSIINADFEFDVPVRFDTDDINITLDNYLIASVNNVPLVEIKI